MLLSKALSILKKNSIAVYYNEKMLGRHCAIDFDYQLLYNCINIVEIILGQI